MNLEIEAEKRNTNLKEYYQIKSIKVNGNNIGAGIYKMLIDIDAGEMNIYALCSKHSGIVEGFDKKFLQEKNIKLYQEIEREEI